MLKLSIQRQINMPYYFLHIQLSKTKIIKNSLLVRMCGNRHSLIFSVGFHPDTDDNEYSPTAFASLHYFLIIQSPRQKNLIG